MTDAELEKKLMLLEQLTYPNNKTGVDPNQYGSVKELINAYDTKSYNDYSYNGGKKERIDYGGLIGGSELNAIINEIKNDQYLMSLKIVNRNEDAAAICYEDPNGKAYVTFRGTNGAEEWKDNIDAITKSDTECQKKALDYIEGLKYDSVTVVGHSKGGNKAQYVAILSDKVDKCISMDGQGFSDKFMSKYSYEIAANSHKIKNYSLGDDYVHILLFPIPNAEQVYVEELGGGMYNHSSAKFFKKDENGNLVINTVST